MNSNLVPINRISHLALVEDRFGVPAKPGGKEDFQFDPNTPFVLGLSDLNAIVSITPGQSFDYRFQGKQADVRKIEVHTSDRFAVFKGPENSLGGHGGISISGGSVYISGGGCVSIGGVDVTEAVRKAQGLSVPVQLDITVPIGTCVAIGNVYSIDSRVALGQIGFRTRSQAKIALSSCADMMGSLTGQCDVKVGNARGSIILALTGQSSLEVEEVACHMIALSLTGQSEACVEGTFAGIVQVSLTGQSEVGTCGLVAGDYIATATGQSVIKHRGGVNGQVIKTCTGQSKISIR